MDNSIKDSLYIKIYKDYKRFIEMGIYQEGDRLPSVRTLALEEGINPNTVQRAYKMLEEEGLIVSINKKGIYVSGKANNTLKEGLINTFMKYKKEGVKKEMLIDVLEEVYNDRD